MAEEKKQNPIVARARAHFANFLVQSIEVPEWGEDDKPLIVYWKPMTLAEKQRLQTIGEAEGYLARLADCLIIKALDADGKKLFTIEDKFSMRNSMDPEVIARVVTRMMTSPGVQEMGKP